MHQRSLESSAYDTAWVASLRVPSNPREPRFPTAFEWLLSHQRPDGSWGGEVAYQHDRILSTLSALRCLLRFTGSERVDRAIRRARTYVWRHAHTLRSEPVELVGFELLLPTLMREVHQAGVTLPTYLDVYEAERTRKLAMIPEALLYSPAVTLVHSLEFLGGDADPARLLGVVSPIGAIGSSPAATALLLDRVEHAPAAAYLEGCLAGDGGAAVPVLHPCETFDLLWSAYHWHLGGRDPRELFTDDEHASLSALLADGRGVSLSPSFPIPDADDTAVAIVLLHARGETPSGAALASFEKDGVYRSFPYERHSSVGVNAHALHALTTLSAPTEAIEAVGRYLESSRTNGAYWIDKWHISPYYATAHVLLTAARFDALCGPALEWIRSTQREDGCWGYYAEATGEETAYAMMALSTSADPGDRERLRRGARWLRDSGARGEGAPPLWVDKCLYNPPKIVSAVIGAALRRCV